MTSKKRVWKLFSVDDLRQEVAKESSLQQLLANFIAFPAENAPESNPRTLEAWLVARYGLLATVEVLSFTRSTMSLPVNEQQRLLATFHPHVDGKHFHVLHRVARTLPAVLKSCQTSVLTPPTSSCLLCPNSPHLSVHHKCNVVVYGFGGARQATKISTRCHRCRNIYNYTSFGNAGDGWTLYQEARDLVEASDACFVERPMFELQCSLANHCWVSFSGWSVAYNEAFGLLSNSLEVSEKQVAATFWNGELEIEVRGTGQLDFYGLFHKNDDREAVMEEIERRRSQSVYVHSSEDCSQDCKKRGCGRLWVADGLWKIMFPHCAMSTKVDSTKETPLCAKQNIRAYPRLKLYYDQGEIKRYNGKRRMNDLKALVDKFAGTSEKESESADTAEADNGLYTLTSENFDKHVEIGLHFIKFYVPWCSHCRKLAPTWKALAEYHKDNMDITIAKIDCTTEGKKCTEHKIHAFPSLKLFKDGREVDSYEGSRSLDDLKNYLTLKISEHSLLSSATTENSETAEEIPSDELDLQIKPFQLTDSNFDSMISFGTIFVKFYAPWCRHCRELAPVWDQLANKCADSSSGPRIAKVDCTTEEELCSSMGIKGYPTLILFSKGVQKQEYKGPRDLDSLYNFAMQHHDEL